VYVGGRPQRGASAKPASPANRAAPLPEHAIHRRIVRGDLVGLLTSVHPDRDASHGYPSWLSELTRDGGAAARSHAR
jgi:hypothetical protein